MNDHITSEFLVQCVLLIIKKNKSNPIVIINEHGNANLVTQKIRILNTDICERC